MASDGDTLPRRRRRTVASTAALLTGLLLAVSACGSIGPSHSAATPGTLEVVAGENFWGNLAAQLGGTKVSVTSVVTDPNADPHEYETSPADARAFAAAGFVILNGAGYDDWGTKLLAAQPETGRRVLNVASLLKKKAGDNPHFWYNPAYVFRVINQITADYEDLRPQAASYFAARHRTVEARLAPYRARLSYLRAHFAGKPVAATESIFQYLAQYLGLDLVSPVPFMKAVSEGIDPPASSVATFDRLIENKACDVLVYNVQTVTPLTTIVRQQAVHQGIPIVGVSETLTPPGSSFELWMDTELTALTRALAAHGTGP